MPHPAPLRGEVTEGRVAVIDLGSNSIRLVVYERASRSPVPIFNEKVLCGLGRRLDRDGRLDPEGVRMALANLPRFVALSAEMEVARLDVLGTAAVRDAEDGPAFVAEVERRCGVKVRVLSGAEEARLSALGLVAGTPEADGLMGDLGGGSLELVALDRGRPGTHATLPLGPLRLAAAAEGDRARARDIIARHLEGLSWLRGAQGRRFYAVGGSWRTLARIQMGQTGYPLHIIHHYAIPRDDAEDMAALIARLGDRSLRRIPGTGGRREVLPFAAMVLEEVLTRVVPEAVVFSAYGLREGHVYDLLDPAERAKDPLVAACTELARHAGRFGPLGEELLAWSAPLFPGESEAQRRLRLCACLLADIGWNDHPDYRAEQAFLRVVRVAAGGIDHVGRIFLALAVYGRYAGGLEGSLTGPMAAILDNDWVQRALAIGLVLRLGLTLCGGAPGVLPRTALVPDHEKLTLVLPPGDEALVGEVVERRLAALAQVRGLRPALASAPAEHAGLRSG